MKLLPRAVDLEVTLFTKQKPNMNAKECNYAAESTGQFNSNPGSEVEQLETDGESRRSFLTKMIVAVAATAAASFPYISARAAENPSIKFGLLEDR